MNAQADERKFYIDIAKAIGILLVVLAHAIPKENFLWICINQFHMPLFFMISGYCYKTKGDWNIYLKKKIKGLYIPFVACSLLTIIIGAVSGMSIGIKKIIKVFLLLDWGPLLGATWFLGVLFYVVIAYDVVHRIMKKYDKKDVVVSIMAIVALVIGLNVRMPLIRMSNMLIAFFFIHCGYLLKQYKFFEKVQQAIVSIAITVISFLAVAGISVINVSSFASNAFTYKTLFVIAALAGSIGTLLLSCNIERCKLKLTDVLVVLGKNTIGIVIWQFVLFKIVIFLQILFYKQPMSRINEYPVLYEYSNVVWIILYMIVGIIGSAWLHKMLSKLAGRLIDFRKSM